MRRGIAGESWPTTTAGNPTEWYAAQARQSGWAGLYIDATWGLTPASVPKPGTEGAVRPREAELRKHRREHREPPRTELAGTVRQARNRARGKGVARFEAELTQLGINWRKRVTDGNRIVGYIHRRTMLAVNPGPDLLSTHHQHHTPLTDRAPETQHP